MPAYREEEHIPPDSKTETFVAIKCFIDNWRWAGVPFYLRTGKRLPTRASEIAIYFKQVPRILYNAAGPGRCSRTCLRFQIQPEEGLKLNIISKLPGSTLAAKPR